MTHQPSPHAVHLRLDAVLTELALYAKALCPEATIHTSAWQYEDEDGCVEVFPLAHVGREHDQHRPLRSGQGLLAQHPLHTLEGADLGGDVCARVS